MIRTVVMITFLIVWPLEAMATSALRSSSCRVASHDVRPAKRALHRLRAARAGRNGRLGQTFPVQRIDEVNQAATEPLVLESTPPDVSQITRQQTEVWPQAWALFPAE